MGYRRGVRENPRNEAGGVMVVRDAIKVTLDVKDEARVEK